MVKNPPATWETRVRSLSWEDPLDKKMTTYSSILAWRILWIEEPGGLQSWGGKELDETERLTHTSGCWLQCAHLKLVGLLHPLSSTFVYPSELATLPPEKRTLWKKTYPGKGEVCEPG